MKTFIMTLTVLLVTSLSSVSAQANEAVVSPIKFKDETAFMSVKGQPILGLTQSDTFIGVLFRLDKPEGDRQNLDLYHFPKNSASGMTDKSCAQIAENIFGPRKKISLKYVSKSTFKSTLGSDICELVLHDPGKGSMFQERRLFALVVGGKTYAIVSNLVSAMDAEDAGELRQFIKQVR